jgi:hypothetical protein
MLVTLIVGLMGATSAYAFRMGGGCGMGPGMGGGKGMHWMMNLTPEQAGQVFDLRLKFMNETAELRKGMLLRWTAAVERLKQVVSRIIPGDWGKVESGWLTWPLSSRIARFGGGGRIHQFL